jgi:hypothetical protein
VHVLVVEDTDDSREMLQMALEYCGALVTTAASAEEAKRILDSIRPHVLVAAGGDAPSAEVRVAFCANAACRAPFVARKAQRYCQAWCAPSGADRDRASAAPWRQAQPGRDGAVTIALRAQHGVKRLKRLTYHSCFTLL